MSNTAEPSAQPTIKSETVDKIERLCTHLYPSGRLSDERRTETRYPFPYLISIAPVESDGTTPLAEPFIVVCKHISQGGIGFYYPEPMPYRYIVVSLPAMGKEQAIHLLVDLTWCRFARKGWYENGGLFVGETDEPALSHLLET